MTNLALAAINLSGNSIGSLLLLFVGLVISCAIVYAIMRACDAPPWMYKVAAVLGLVLLLIIVICVFFGGSFGTGVDVHSSGGGIRVN